MKNVYLKNQKAVVLFIFFLFVLGFSLIQRHSEKVVSAEILQQYANETLITCSTSNHRQNCYDKEIPKLMDQPISLTMEDAFEIVRLVQDKDKSFPYCHVLGHNLSAKEVKKNHSKWQEVLSRCPSGVCSNGCIHGGFQERFRAESFTDQQIEKIKGDLKTICEKRSNWNPTGLEQASCYHAIGHLTMYLTSANTNKSVKLCEEISIKEDGRSFVQVCLDGVFMQIFQPLEPEDFALIYDKEVTRAEVDNFCSAFNGVAKASCLSESWPLFRQEIMASPQALVRFCSKEQEKDQARCFEGMFYVLTAQFNFDENKIKSYCLQTPEHLIGKCFASTASRMIETDYKNIDRAILLCFSVANVTVQEKCFNELVEYSTYNFHTGSEEFLKLCNGLPIPWKNRCLN